MSFFKLIIDEREQERHKMNTRPTVKGIAFKDDALLLIRTNRGAYKIPGGGVGRRETFEKALIREINEETGFKCTKVGDKIGEIEEFKNDIFNDEADFCMHSFYYEIQVLERQGLQKLDPYEAKLEFRPCWIRITDAIKANEKVLCVNDDLPWLEREIKILDRINQFYNAVSNVEE